AGPRLCSDTPSRCVLHSSGVWYLFRSIVLVLFGCEVPSIVSIRSAKTDCPQSVPRRATVLSVGRPHHRKWGRPFSACGARIIFTNSHCRKALLQVLYLRYRNI